MTTAAEKGEFGEGNYKAAKEYQRDATGFAKENAGKIEQKAREAAKALDGAEGDELRRAEEEARNQGKS